ncbi:peptidase inhibitor family I36 protein [Crossiella sp. CA198]|uniref:peptidase inhibitor family I36 protein n=1 Tax=Crossiella sp. CA198 TaxID=3455607 RepID=UPI003F8D2D69
MSKARLAGAALAAFATAATLGLAGATPAEAALADCPNGNICVWDAGRFQGKPFYVGNPGSINYFFSGAWPNDVASSLSNKTGRDLCWYEHADPRTGAVWGRHDHPSYFLDAQQLSPNDSMTAIGVCV